MKSQEFIAALRQLEDQGDVEPIVKLFAEGAQLWNPTLQGARAGQEGARAFWQEYRDTFERIHSEFLSVIDADGQSALEWKSTGQLGPGDRQFEYRGVSILEWSGGRISRFAAYFDPTALSSGLRQVR